MFKETEERPPYVIFQVRAEEDRQASKDAGHYVTKDVNYAIITPQGSKDRVERIADDWLAYLQEQVDQGRFKPEWLHRFKEGYAAWKAGQEIPENGIAIRNWPVLSPSQIDALLYANIRTVEDLAIANEEAISRLGMGGRSLQYKAREWLAAAAGSGKQVEEITSLKLRNEELTAQVLAMQTQLQELSRASAPNAKAAQKI